MKKVMPNDKCPCMSGKKYKFCCAKNQDFVKYVKEVLGGDYIDTSYILNDITEKSDRLKKYLNDILPKINMQIIFVLNPELNANMRACGTEGGEFGAIIIKEIPIQEKDFLI